MQLFKWIVCSVFSKSDFIGDAKKRAKLFELTDNEVAVFRITLPEEEFAQLKEDVSSGEGMPPPPQLDENGNLLPPPGAEIGSDGRPILDFGEEFKTKNGTLIVEVNK